MPHPIGYEGEPLALTDGRNVHVLFVMRSLLHLERDFDGLGNIQSKLAERPVAGTLDFLAAGLLHVKAANGEPLRGEILADHLDVTLFEEYGALALRAFGAAFPKAVAKAEAEAADKAGNDDGSPAKAKTPSRGTSGTTSRP